MIPPIPAPPNLPDAPSPAPATPTTASSANVPTYTYAIAPDIPAPLQSPLMAQTYPYLVWYFEEVIRQDFGYRASPVAAAPGTPEDVVRIHGGNCEKFVIFSAVRIGADPIVPSRAPTAPNDVLADAVLSRSLVGFLLDGTPVIEIDGVYKYIVRQGPAESDPSNLAAPPFSNLTPLWHPVGSGVFSGGIYQAGQPAGAPADKITF